MKVAVVNTFHAKDIANWSGIPYHISLLLDNIFNGQIDYIKLPKFKRSPVSYLRGFYYNRVIRKKYYTWADEKVIAENKEVISLFLKNDYELIITFDFYLVPLLKTNKNKVIHWNDANFSIIHNFYPGYSNFSNYSLKSAHSIQKKALDLSDIVIYSSDWALESAVTFYKTDRSKLRKILFASNFKYFIAKSDVESFIKDRDIDTIKLLFLAADWSRKGGDDAVAVVNSLNIKGVKAQLYVVGTNIPAQHKNNKDVIAFGFVDKSSSYGEAQLITLFKKCAFLLLPSRIDLTPVAFSEASSFALPSITTDIGGIPSVIKQYVNGHYFPVASFIENATNFIINNHPNTEHYTKLCYSSFAYYESDMSWEQVKQKFLSILEDLS
ncbi:glycosyltransferase family 4 protein [Hymenobacter sp. HD11105]